MHPHHVTSGDCIPLVNQEISVSFFRWMSLCSVTQVLGWMRL